MFALLHQYLVDYSSINLPGIGTLQFKDVPASFDITHSHIYPSSKKLALFPDIADDNQQPLIGFLSKRMDMPEDETHIMFHHFLVWAKTAIETENILRWNNLGEFHKGENDTILFVQSNDLEQYLQPVNAKNSNVRQHSNYKVLVGGDEMESLAIEEQLENDEPVHKNYWWVWAIAIAAVSAALITFKYWR